MAGKKRASGRHLSEMVAAFGPDVRDLPDALYVRLALNLPHLEDRKAAAVLRGLAASGDAPLDPGLADALADTPEGAAELLFQANADRADARRKREGGH